MPSLFRYLLLLGLLVSWVSCKEDPVEPDPPMDDCTIEPSGFTLRDANGVPLGALDQDDWRTDDEWTSAERNFFTTTARNNCAASENLNVSAFPNPVADILALNFDRLSQQAIIDLAFVDTDCMVLGRNSVTFAASPGGAVLQIDLDQLGSSGDTLRLYYRINYPNCTLYGHGDVRKE